MRLFSLVLFLATFSAPVLAGRAEDLREIAAIVASLEPLPPRNDDRWFYTRYRKALAELREVFDATLDPAKLKHVRIWDAGGDAMSRLRAHVRLYRALLADMKALGDRIDHYQFRSYQGETDFRLPEAFQLRFDVAEVLWSGAFNLFREDAASLRKVWHEAVTFHFDASGGWGDYRSVRITRRGLLAIVSGSPIALRFLQRLEQNLETAMTEFDHAVAPLVDGVISATDADVPRRAQELEEFISLRHRVAHQFKYLRHHITAVLPFVGQMAAMPSLTELEHEMDVLGAGLQFSLATVRAQRELAIPPGAWVVLDPWEEFNHLLGRGGNGSHHYGSYFLGSDVPAAQTVLSATTTVGYLLVAGAAIARLEGTEEGQESWWQALGTEMRFRAAQLRGRSGPNAGALVPTVSTPSAPLHRASFAPVPVQAKRRDLDQHLWNRFLKAAGLIDGPHADFCGGAMLAEALLMLSAAPVHPVR